MTTPKPRRTTKSVLPDTEQENIELLLKVVTELKKRADKEGGPAHPYWTKFKSTRLQTLIGVGLTSLLGVLDGSVPANDALLVVGAVAIAYITGKSVQHMVSIWASAVGKKTS